jgi:hypothetical protein
VRATPLLLALALGVIVSAPTALAQDAGRPPDVSSMRRSDATARSPEGAQEFGTSDLGITIVPYSEFFPSSSDSATYVSSTGVLGKRWLASAPVSGTTLVAPLSGIPNGATLVRADFYVDDSDATDNVEARIVRNFVDANTGADPSANFLFTINSSGSPGATVITALPDVVIRYEGDADGDPAAEVVAYNLTVDLQKPSSGLAIRAVRLLWKRNLSPAPAAATFGDVPTDHIFFRHIEALFRAGITAGCQGSPLLYCPGQAVTRGEMAAFLAKALGLHWPGP